LYTISFIVSDIKGLTNFYKNNPFWHFITRKDKLFGKEKLSIWEVYMGDIQIVE